MSIRDKSYIIGIDLGTSNCALSYTAKSEHLNEPQILQISQVVEPGRLDTRKTLPSAIYLSESGNEQEGDLKLPWESSIEAHRVIGSYARKRGGEVADLVVQSAKSWLCNPFIERQKEILPWESKCPGKLSPVEASKIFLMYLKEAFLEQVKDAEWSQCQVILTVPASFDEVARTLTVQAAKEAGYQKLQLLEEPQAAFYSWLQHREKDWRNDIEAGDVILVCDVGGGTTDFSLILALEDQKELALERISVGKHLLLGGDNMDLALSHLLLARAEENGQSLDRWQKASLTAAIKDGKEKLFSNPELEKINIAIPQRGAKLFAKSVSLELLRDDLKLVVEEGFFPLTDREQKPSQEMDFGLKEFGLQYESDPAISKHLAEFLSFSRANLETLLQSNEKLAESMSDAIKNAKDFITPHKVLFNGGVFNASHLRQRVLTLLNSWAEEEQSVEELQHYDLDLAVTHGANTFGQIKESGKGLKISAGTAHSYYLGVESKGLAIPGVKPKIKGLCLVPQGTEEGSHLKLESRPFGLVTGKPVSFRFFSSNQRAQDQFGALIENADQDLMETSNLSVTLSGNPGQMVPVTIDAEVSEVGILNLFLKHQQSDQRWELEFNIRAQES